MNPLYLIMIGFAIGTFGTLIGAGGGFILMPLLFFLYPQASPDYLTSISLAIVLLNAGSGSIAYAKDRKIDYRSGIIFSVAALPGAILGAFSTSYLSRKFFDPIFGVILIAFGTYLFLKSRRKKHSIDPIKHPKITRPTQYNMKLGIALSIFVGFISSILGIGGGIIHVPILVQLLNFPVHIATATSHFILAILAFIGTITHFAMGTIDYDALIFISYFSPGVILGAQIGARLSRRLKGTIIIQCLAVALAIVGLRLLALTRYGAR